MGWGHPTPPNSVRSGRLIFGLVRSTGLKPFPQKIVENAKKKRQGKAPEENFHFFGWVPGLPASGGGTPHPNPIHPHDGEPWWESQVRAIAPSSPFCVFDIGSL